MAKVPSGQTIASYQSSLADKLNNSDNGLDKATNQAILSKTNKDKVINLLKKQIEEEQKYLDKLKEELATADKLSTSHENILKLKKDIKTHQDSINKLNEQGVLYLQTTVDRLVDITTNYKKQLDYQEASLDKKLELKRVERESLELELKTLNNLKEKGQLEYDAEKKRLEVLEKYKRAKEREESLAKSISVEEEKRMTYSQKRAAQEERLKKALESLKKAQIERDAVLNDKNSTQKEKEFALSKYIKEYNKISGTLKDSKYEQFQLKLMEKTGGKLDKIVEGVGSINKGIGFLRTGLDKSVDNAMNVFTNDMGKLDASLYGTNLTFTKMQKDITNNLGLSSDVYEQERIDN